LNSNELNFNAKQSLVIQEADYDEEASSESQIENFEK